MIIAKRKMPIEQAYEILKSSSYGVLSVASKDGIPYGVPLNYFYVEEDNALYFHGLFMGRKTDYIKENNKASFVVIGMEQIMPEKFVTHYDSVMVEGTISIIYDEEEKIRKIIQLCDIFAPGMPEKRDEIIAKEIKACVIMKLDIKEVVGKKNRDE